MSVIFKDLPFPRWKRLPSIVDFVNHCEPLRLLLKGVSSAFIYFLLLILNHCVTLEPSLICPLPKNGQDNLSLWESNGQLIGHSFFLRHPWPLCG